MGVQGVQVGCHAQIRALKFEVSVAQVISRDDNTQILQMEELWSLDKESLEALRCAASSCVGLLCLQCFDDQFCSQNLLSLILS